MQPYPRAPDLVWPGHLHDTGRLSARAMNTGFPTVVWRLCLGLGFVVTPPIQAGVLGGCAWVRVLVLPYHSWLGFVVCAVGLGFLLAPRHSWLRFWGVRGCVRASPLPRRSWLGCAVWLCVLGLGFRLRPATPGRGVGVCVCLCARSSCSPPILAEVCGVDVCACTQVSAARRYSWLGCLGVCVFVRALRLYPAPPGSGVRCGCVCLGSGWGSAPPLLAGMLGCVCGYVRAPFVGRHSWLWCAVWVCVLWLGSRLRPATPGQGVGVCVCLHARSTCAPPLLARVCGVGVCPWPRVSAAPRHSWLGCWVVCVFVCGLHLYPATPCWRVRCVCVCLGSNLVCALPLLAGVLRCVCFLCALRLYPAAPSSVVRCGCVFLGSVFGCAPPLLAGLFVCVSVCVRTLFVPCSSWLGCTVWVCALGLRLQLRPATHGWGVEVCVCLCARSACTLTLLAGVCGVGVCVLARASAVPRHSWQGCWGVYVFVCALRLCPGTPSLRMRCSCLCFGSGFGCAPPLLAGMLAGVSVCVRAPLPPCHSFLNCALWVCVLGLGFQASPRHSCMGSPDVCVFVSALRLYPATPGWGVRCGCVCLGSCFGCAPPLLPRVLGCVCVRVRAPLVPHHSWPGCAVWGCVLGLRFRLRPATPGWGVGVCVLFVRAPFVPCSS